MQSVASNGEAQNSTRVAFACMHTHQLPYGVRRNICDLLDSDNSWQILGGQVMHLDSTQLQLVGRAVLRNGSPTGELLNKLDTANARTSDLYRFLHQMQHLRALELLKPFVISETQYNYHSHQESGSTTTTTTNNNNNNNANIGSLHTPTPSFNSIQPMAIMSPSEFDLIAPSDYQNQNPQDWEFVVSSYQQQQQPIASTQQEPRICDNASDCTDSQRPERIQQRSHPQNAPPDDNSPDPGDDIVRMACTNNKKRTSISDQEVVNQLRLIMQIDYNELKQASNDFADSNILGNGGFASVYRGHWKGTDVAIKRLRCNLMDQALNELTILNSYRIDNILPIYGISIDGPEACLVYQFMANGSLEDRLSCKNGSQPLTWHQRSLIAEGVAKGLYYLHTLRDKPLVHGDAKSANVLLDSQFVPKLGDFGLARQVFRGMNPQTELATHCTVSSIHGTSVYLPPEYLRHKILSPAVDVYSYGIVLLEMATGKRAYDGKRLLIDFVEDELKTFETMAQINYNLKDHRLADNTTSGLKICFELLLRLGINCAHRIKKKRPDMGQVLNNFALFNSIPAGGHVPGIDDAIVNTSLILKPLSNPGSVATTRTLTPDVSSVHWGAVNENGFPFNQQQLPAEPRQVRHNSTLMSVDEDDELSAQKVDRNRPAPIQTQVADKSLMFNYENQFGEQILHQHQHQHPQPYQQLQPQYQPEASETNKADVMDTSQEKLIPFLTELGISTKPGCPDDK